MINYTFKSDIHSTVIIIHEWEHNSKFYILNFTLESYNLIQAQCGHVQGVPTTWNTAGIHLILICLLNEQMMVKYSLISLSFLREKREGQQLPT